MSKLDPVPMLMPFYLPNQAVTEEVDHFFRMLEATKISSNEKTRRLARVREQVVRRRNEAYTQHTDAFSQYCASRTAHMLIQECAARGIALKADKAGMETMKNIACMSAVLRAEVMKMSDYKQKVREARESPDRCGEYLAQIHSFLQIAAERLRVKYCEQMRHVALPGKVFLELVMDGKVDSSDITAMSLLVSAKGAPGIGPHRSPRR